MMRGDIDYDEFEERPKLVRVETLHLLPRTLLFFAAILLAAFTLALGGRNASVVRTFELGVALLVAVPAVSALLGCTHAVIGFALPGISRKLVVLTVLVLGVGLIQLAPFPISSLQVLSPQAALRYGFLGEERAPLSLDAYLTAESVWFFAAWLGFVIVLAALPGCIRLRYGLTAEKIERFQSYLCRLCTADYATAFLQTSLIRLGVLSSVIAIVHWGLRAEEFMGLVDPGIAADPSRAHWPLINPNHLAVVLEICSLTALGVVLRDSQVLSLVRRQARAERIRGMSKLAAFGQLRTMLALFTMWTAILLTLSRTGATLSFLGALSLFFYAGWNSPRTEGRSSRSSSRRARRLAETAVLGTVIIIGLLFFLGDTGRDLLAGRVEYAINERLDYYRVELYRTTLKMVRLYPLFGVGLGCWRLGAAPQISRELGGWTLDYAHNDPLQFLAEAGLIGSVPLLLCGWTLLTGLRRGLRLPDVLPSERVEIVGAFLAVGLPIMHSFVDFPFRIPAVAVIWGAGLCVFVRLLTKVNSATVRC